MSGVKKYYIIVIGCQMNKSDSERVAGYLEGLGYKKAVSEKRADIVVVTTCGVRQSAEDRAYGLIPKIKSENPKAKIVVTGCLSRRKDVRKRLKKYVDIWLPVNEISNLKLQIPNNFQNTKQGTQKNKRHGKNYLSVIPKYTSKFSAFVPIGNGCDNFCSYCVVPYARGREEYRPAEEIIAEVKNLVKRGYKEIILIAQNVNSYKSKISNFKFQISNKIQNSKSKSIFFSGLLKLVNNIKGNFWIRFVTSHPKDMSDELIKTITECEKVCRHIHLPAQAGDNKVLKRMNRKYTREHYTGLIKKIRRNLNSKFAFVPSSVRLSSPKSDRGEIRNSKSPLERDPALNKNNKVAGQIQNSKFKIKNLWNPPVAITSDIIVGFPGETKKQFDNTAKLFKEAKFDMAYVARYSPRPETAAAKMEDNVSSEEKKKREERLTKTLRKTALKNNKEYIGKIVEVLVEREKDGAYFGKTETNKMVKCQMSNVKCQVGEFVYVKITKVNDFGLSGEIIC